MKGYVVTLLNLPQSVESANRCVTSAKQFGVDVDIFPAVYKDVAKQEVSNEGLKLNSWDTSWSNPDAVIGNFVAQYRVWKAIVDSGEPGIVLEHDAVFVANIPDLGDHSIVNLGKPSFNNLRARHTTGIVPLVTSYLFGAHGYYLSVNGAQRLVDTALRMGVAPCDVFLNVKNFPDIKEYYPWPIEAHDTFTTIQKAKGCKSKHNFGDDYEII